MDWKTKFVLVLVGIVSILVAIDFIVYAYILMNPR